MEEKNIIGYMIVDGFSCSDLQEQVNKYIEIGWQPIGGLSIKYSRNSSYFHTVEEYYQTMVRY